MFIIRGRDARANLHLLPTGEMVYFVAAVVVLYNVEEQAQRHYLGHTADIKCMSVHPNKLLIATGQASSALERPHVRIWNSVSLQTVHTLGLADFEHNICCVSFSKADGGNLLVAVEESEHTISVSNYIKQEICKHHQHILICFHHPGVGLGEGGQGAQDHGDEVQH